MEVAGLHIVAPHQEVNKARDALGRFVSAAKAAQGAANGLAGATGAAEAAARGAASAAQHETNALGANSAALRVNSAAHMANAQSARAAAFAQRNMIFQLNDVVVSLASGMSLQMVALQQGSQILQNGIGSAFQAIVGLGRMVLVTFAPVLAIVAAVAAVFTAFTTEINRGQKQQVGFFDVVIAGWELVTEAIGRAIGPAVEWFAWLWDQASPIITDLGVLIIRTFDLAFRNIGTIFGQLPAMLGDLTISTAQAVIDGTEAMINGAIKLINDFVGGARDLLGSLGIEVGEIGNVEFGTLANKWQGAMGGIGGKLSQNLQDVNSTDYLGALGDRAREVASRPSDDATKKAATEAERHAEAYADLVRGSQQFIASQNLEAQAIGMTTESAAALRYQQEMLNKAANDNISLSAAQKAEIESLAGAMAAAEERTRGLKAAYDFSKETFSGFFADMRGGLKDGMNWWQSFANAGVNALNKILDKAFELLASGIFDMIMGATGGGWVGALASMFFANGGAFQHGALQPFARGGVVDQPTVFPMARGMGLMGEAGPEAVMPLKRTPDGRLGVAAQNDNRAGGVIEVRVSLDDDMLNVRIDNRAAGVSAQVVQGGLTAYDSSAPARSAEQQARFG